jgi:adenosylcobyric acid synthase
VTDAQPLDYPALREASLDRLADAFAQSLDLDALAQAFGQ